MGQHATESLFGLCGGRSVAVEVTVVVVVAAVVIMFVVVVVVVVVVVIATGVERRLGQWLRLVGRLCRLHECARQSFVGGKHTHTQKAPP